MSRALADPVQDAPGHPAVGIQDERAAQRTTDLFVEHPVGTGDVAVRPVVGEQVEGQLFGVGKGPEGEHRVAGDGDDPGTGRFELTGRLAEAAEFAGTDIAERPRIEHHDSRTSSQIAEPDRLTMLIPARESGSELAHLGRHRREPRGRTSLLAAQSAEMAAPLVSERPAVTAASEMSAAST